MDTTTDLPTPNEPSAIVVDLTNLAQTHWQGMRGNETPRERMRKTLAPQVANRILTETERLRPKILVLTRDTGRQSFRAMRWSQYKAGRKRDTDFLAEMDVLSKWYRALGVPVLEDEGFEADDQIGTIVGRLRVAIAPLKVVIWSGDHDMLSLVDEQTMLWNGKTLKASGPADVISTYKVRPSQFAEFLALVGDKDEAPGVTSIGEMRAGELLVEHGTLARAINATAWKSGSVYEALKRQENVARMSLELVTLRRDAPAAMGMGLDDAAYGWSKDMASAADCVAIAEHRKMPELSGGSKNGMPLAWVSAWNSLPAMRAMRILNTPKQPELAARDTSLPPLVPKEAADGQHGFGF